MTRSEFGKLMIQHGEWSEFHQRKAREMAHDSNKSAYHRAMYGWHHARYIELKHQHRFGYAS